MKTDRESELRLRAFHIFYRRTFKSEINPLHRFVKALLASAQPIQNPELVEEFLNTRSRECN